MDGEANERCKGAIDMSGKADAQGGGLSEEEKWSILK
jgi:hypothetical protein